MAAKYEKFRGYSAYAMMYKPDEFMDKKYWKISFYPETSKVMDAMKAKGVRLKIYEDDGSKSGVEGQYYVIKRPTEKNFKGVPTDFHPPVIYDKDGKILVGYDKETLERVGEPVLIGNGSLVEVTVCIYDAPPYGKGTRLESVKILDLIEYNPPEEVTENEVDESEESNDGLAHEGNPQINEPKPEANPEKKARVKW